MFFNDVKGKKAKRERSMFVPMEYVKTDFIEFDDSELLSHIGKPFVFDCEVYPNLFYVGFRCVETGKIISIEQSDEVELNTGKLNWLIWNLQLIGFNSISYDIPILTVALSGRNNDDIKEASDMLIKQGATRLDFEKEFKVRIPFKLNHIDLIEVAPLEGSLKLYAGRLHAPRMQDLPYPDDTFLDYEQRQAVKLYCLNDLENTELLYKFLSPQLELRRSLSAQYGQDLMSKSDAQITEAVVISETKKITGRYPRKIDFVEGETFNYSPPDFIKYSSPELLAMLDKVVKADFVINEFGRPRCEAMEELNVTVGNVPYTMGIGGLHSKEKSITHLATDDIGLFDNDVASYYPRCILNSGLYPKALGPVSLEIYASILERRLIAKKNKVAVEADSLKITANGYFGKTGSPHSVIYKPELMIYTTLTGQLSILMLIEFLSQERFEVISANTDGIIIKVERSRKWLMDQILTYWQAITKFDTEETEYKAVYSKDVNNYLAIKTNGEVKQKGSYSEKGSTGNTILAKNPTTFICSDAVIAFLKDKKPIKDTIFESRDIRRFVNVRTVKGGAEKDGYYLGKVVRWYYAINTTGQINYVISGNKVPESDGAKPCMDMPTVFPDDINYAWYLAEADKMLYEIGYKQVSKQELLV